MSEHSRARAGRSGEKYAELARLVFTDASLQFCTV